MGVHLPSKGVNYDAVGPTASGSTVRSMLRLHSPIPGEKEGRHHFKTLQENITMEKLNKQITKNFYRNPWVGYRSLQDHWSCLMQDKARRTSLTAAHHLLYLILLGRNWQRAFTPMTNPVKLVNGGFYNWGARRALQALHSPGYTERLLEPFAQFLNPEAIHLIRELVPPLEWNTHPLEREPYDG
jgi:hypothetical protein